MKKVLIVFNHPAPYKVALFNGLAQHVDLHVIFERDRASDRNKLFYAFCEDDYLFTQHQIKGIKIGRENIISRGVKNHIKKNEYDLIIMNGYSTFAEMKALRYLKRKQIPYIFYINGGVVKKESKLKRKIKSYFINGATHYMSPSEEADEYLIHYGVDPSKITHYPYATVFEKDVIRKPLSKEDKLNMRKAYGISDARYLFMSVGQYIDRKNNLRLLEIWKHVPENVYLFLIGDGVEKPLYETFIKENNLSNVRLIDFLPHHELLQTLRMGDYAVFLSKEDIYGHMVNEAMSQGLGVVASPKIVAARTLIKPGKNGFLIDSFDTEEILNKLKAITKIDTFEQATNSALNNTIEKMVDAHVEFLARFL